MEGGKSGKRMHCGRKRERAASSKLPVEEARSAIVELVKKNTATVLIGETGSGKSTMVPQFVYDHILRSGPDAGKLVGVTQPRRVAAVTLARYVAQQRESPVGGEVGYAVRFDDKTSQATRIKFMTDGILLREIQADPSLSKYAVLVLDEAHERTLHGDVLFGLVKSIVAQRRSKDLKVVVMSATLNAKQFSSFWFNAPIGVVHGRVFPVTVMHTVEPQTDFVEATISTVLRLHIEEGPGDILCFLTGQDDIEDAMQALKERMKRLPQQIHDFHVVPLYAALPYEKQLAVFDPSPSGLRKVILATNIAETSITVEGIKFVVDCGCVKAKSFNPQIGLESLKVVPVSKAQAMQRTGRAGRVAAGKCFRLYTDTAFDALPDSTVPEIRRCSLSSIVLQMKALGIRDVQQFDFMDPPPMDAVGRAQDVLYLLGALDARLDITPLGKRLNDFPLEPTAAKALLAGQALGVANDMVVVVAMLATENIFLNSMENRDKAEESRRKFAVGSGDHVTYLHLFRQYLQQPRHARREWCDSFSFSHRQLVFVEETCKQLGALLSTAEPTAEWFSVKRTNSEAGTASKRQAEYSELDDVATKPPSRKGGDVFDDNEKIRRAVCFGYCLNSAFYDAKAKEYRSIASRRLVYLHPTSVLFGTRRKPQLVVYNNVVQTTKSFMKDVSVVQEQWLQDAAPHVFVRQTGS